jgi:hypothetical protein
MGLRFEIKWGVLSALTVWQVGSRRLEQRVGMGPIWHIRIGGQGRARCEVLNLTSPVALSLSPTHLVC